MSSDLIPEGAISFMMRLRNEFNWPHLFGEMVMDIGCGEFFNCSQAIANMFTGFRCLIASDKREDVLQWPQLQNEYFENLIKKNRFRVLVADIEDSSSFKDYIGSVDKIVARNVLQEVDNKMQALKNIYKILKPGGAAAILFGLDYPIGTWTNKMLSTSEWSGYIDNSKPAPPSYFPSEFQEQSYKDEMDALGCQKVHAVTRSRPCTYPSHGECQGSLVRIADKIFKIPPERREEFKEDCLRIFKQVVGCTDNDGPINYSQVELFLHIVK